MNTDQDSSYKFLFSSPELVRDLILGFIPDEWLHSLDYNTLEKVPGSYVSEDFRQREDDIVWRVKVGGDWLYLYLLIEFQSSVDKYMALRVMVYLGLLYQDLIKRGDVLTDGRLPPVLPIVLYNGSKPWNAATDILDLIPRVPGLIEQFKPHLKYLLIDENAYTDHELDSVKNLVAAIFQIEQRATPETIGSVIGRINDWLIDQPALQRTIALWIRASLMRKAKYRIILPEVDDLQELRIMLSERMEQWAHGYKAEGKLQGRLEGKLEGEMLSLQKLLIRRFGAIPADVTAIISAGNLQDIELWFDRAIDANSLEEVFVPTQH